MVDITQDNGAGEAHSQKPSSAAEHFSQELEKLRAPSPAVVAKAIRDAIDAHTDATANAEAGIADVRAGLIEDFHSFLALHAETAAFSELKANRQSLLDLTLMNTGERSDEQA